MNITHPKSRHRFFLMMRDNMPEVHELNSLSLIFFIDFDVETMIINKKKLLRKDPTYIT